MAYVVTKTKVLRFEVIIDYTGRDGYSGCNLDGEGTKNKAFLRAARECGRIYAQGSVVDKVQIIDNRTGENVHKCGDDLYWLY